MFAPLHDDQPIAVEILRSDIPGVTVALALSADAEPLPLSKCVEHEPDVPADEAAIDGVDVAGVRWKVAVQKLAKRPFADEADAGRIAFVVIGQAFAARDLADLPLVKRAQRKKRLRKLRLVQSIQEVALVLGPVLGLQKLEQTVEFANLRVMAGRDEVGAEPERVLEEGAKLDLGVAQHVRIRGPAGAIFRQKLVEHPLLVLGRKVDCLDVDTDAIGNCDGLDQVLARRAVLIGIVVFPVLHEQADDIVPLLFEQKRSNRRIDPAGHSDDDPFTSSHYGKARQEGGGAPEGAYFT